VTPECKAKVAKFASINGNGIAARKYIKLLGKKHSSFMGKELQARNRAQKKSW